MSTQAIDGVAGNTEKRIKCTKFREHGAPFQISIMIDFAALYTKSCLIYGNAELQYDTILQHRKHACINCARHYVYLTVFVMMFMSM